MNSPAQLRITRWITRCIQPTNSGELEKKVDYAPAQPSGGHSRKPAGDAQEGLLGAMHNDVKLFAQIKQGRSVCANDNHGRAATGFAFESRCVTRLSSIPEHLSEAVTAFFHI